MRVEGLIESHARHSYTMDLRLNCKLKIILQSLFSILSILSLFLVSKWVENLFSLLLSFFYTQRDISNLVPIREFGFKTYDNTEKCNTYLFRFYQFKLQAPSRPGDVRCVGWIIEKGHEELPQL